MRKKSVWRRFLDQWELQIMILPAVAFMIVFCYVPIFGNVIAFQDYKPLKGVFGSAWVGLKHFRSFFKDMDFWLALKNTLRLSGCKFLFTYFAPVIFAVILNELPYVRFKKLTQTASYLPHFLSYVIVASMAIVLLGPNGVVNRELTLRSMGNIGFLTESRLFWKLAVILDLWKETGWNAIIYLAAITGVNPELYEAAMIDGATRTQRIAHVTLPSISWTMLMLLILNVGSLLSGGAVGSNFDQSYMLGNSFNHDASYVLNHYVLDLGMSMMRFSFSTAINMFESLISVILLVSTNWIVGKLTDSSLF